MKIYKMITSFCLLCYLPGVIHGQDIYIAVYNGTVKFNNNRTLSLNFRYTVKGVDQVNFMKNSRSIIFMFSPFRYFEIEPGSGDESMNIEGIKKKMQNEKVQNKNSFMAYLSSLHVYSSLQSVSKGAVLAGVKGVEEGGQKAGEEKQDPFQPVDSLKLLSGTINLAWQLDNYVFGSKLLVINQLTNDTVYNKPATQRGQATIAMIKEGTYHWFIYSSLEKKKHVNRVIIKPGTVETKRLLDEIESLKQQVSSFGEELQALLLEDYLFQKRIQIN
jgi:hypothetical protein